MGGLQGLLLGGLLLLQVVVLGLPLRGGGRGSAGWTPPPAQGIPGSQLGVAWGGYLDGGRPLLLGLLLLLEGIELLLAQELGPRVHGELAGVLHVGGGAAAPVHGGPQ